MNRDQRKLNREVKAYMKNRDMDMRTFQRVRVAVRRNARLSWFMPCENCDNMYCRDGGTKRFICSRNM